VFRIFQRKITTGSCILGEESLGCIQRFFWHISVIDSGYRNFKYMSTLPVILSVSYETTNFLHILYGIIFSLAGTSCTILVIMNC
jgi:hypothetical protein